ncbi:penicillin-binding transpeptidase domain-containing protein [Dellaglioa algida]|uniref:Penicillin-binding protein 2B n=1 Tax=Dellaglioa algida TaxID=105612 RepID=A0A2C8EMV8_9LACO|nr:penicillin-binding transpeptidase domain-containing protein [Dellaglioa algida]MDK1717403.1 penicillin-binding transpeptidase domain-containing protein [Dellaglioa algida]MDK1718236.1 penicillin-binding transpeptidase domain-containing protein [Dellaglioa algida]MDK1720722.1 penicillin-binding transpeptidase domain-containing protein [Dellaglioa algida]MDK1722345.1 penicillin-binding transpeptidase domain-containing protein [Dellaglioa algida]MDK1723969.1 penicillin-binding transpeptidase d
MNNQKQRMINDMKKKRRNRQRFGVLLILTVLAILLMFIIRFSYIVIGGKVSDVNLSSQTQSLYENSRIDKASRGTIYDDSNQPIAEDTTNYSVYAVLSKTYVGANHKPLYVTDKRKAAKVIGDAIGMKENKVYDTLNAKKGTFQVEFGNSGKNLSLETKNKINSAGLSGIYFTKTQARLYPNGVFASHLIGVTKTTEKTGDSKLSGVMGLELAFNKQLSGTDGLKEVQKDSYGYQLPNSKTKTKTVENGSNIYTTIDTKLQTYLETTLTQVQKKYNPKSMNVVVMNAKNGKILAGSQRPTFNADTKSGISKMWRNTLIEDSYEPGSTMKVFTMAAAIENGAYNENATYKSGVLKVGTKMVPDWNTSGWGLITYREGFARSSNVGMAKLEQIMGPNAWLEYIKKFGFLKSTNLGLASEANGSIEFQYPIEQADTAFGQGINVTTMQMMQGFTAFANNGKMIKPTLVDKIVDPNTGKTTYQAKTTSMGQVIKKSTSQEVLSMMQDVIYKDYGTGNAFKIDGYKLAAKTGTAQIANSDGTGYLTGDANYVFSVVGMAPAKDPKYVIYVTMKQPQNMQGTTGNDILAQVFNPLMKRTLEEDSSTALSSSKTNVMVADVKGSKTSSAKSTLNEQNLDVAVIGNGRTIANQYPAAGATVLSGRKVLLVTDGEMVMPDLTGWSKSDAVNAAEIMKLNITTTGSGYVSEQSIKANTVVKKSTTVKLTLK